MPPKAKITKEMIVDAAFEITREQGINEMNARSVSKRLDCSTQPVMYHFKKIEDLRKVVEQKADEYHTGYLMNCHTDEPMMDIGLNYIRFAATEKNLFCLLFQSNHLAGKNISELICAEDVQPILQVLSEAVQVSLAEAKTIFTTLALFVHGYASMLANNTMTYDEEAVAKDLERVLIGAIYTSKEGNTNVKETL